MTLYAATSFSKTDGDIATIVAAMKTHLQTRDSTNNPIWEIDIVRQDEITKYTGIVVTKGA